MGLLSFLKRDNDPSSKKLEGSWSLIKAEGDFEVGEGVTMAFTPDGRLVYVIHQKDSKQIMNLVFRVKDSSLITNQPSHPSEETTKFSFDAEGNLLLHYDGSKAWFARADL
jgi:hypothetical protein